MTPRPTGPARLRDAANAEDATDLRLARQLDLLAGEDRMPVLTPAAERARPNRRMLMSVRLAALLSVLLSVGGGASATVVLLVRHWQQSTATTPPVPKPPDAPPPPPRPHRVLRRSDGTTKAAEAPAPATDAPPPPAPRHAPARRVALPLDPPPVPPEIAQEAELLREVLLAVRDGHDPHRALALLDTHAARFPRGALTTEAAAMRAEVLLRLGNREAALTVLDGLSLTNTGGSPQLVVTRGELRSLAGRCAEAGGLRMGARRVPFGRPRPRPCTLRAGVMPGARRRRRGGRAGPGALPARVPRRAGRGAPHASMISLVLAAAVVASPIAVQGSGDCPSPAQVAASLSGLSAADADSETDMASVVTDGPDVVITVRGPDGSPRLTRRIARVDGSPSNCAALATAAAVVIATWQIERNAELSLLQPGVYPPAPPAPARPAETVVETTRQQPAAVREPDFFAIGVAVGTSGTSAGFTDTAQIQIAARPHGWPVGLSACLAADAKRDQALASGTATWRRMTAGLGPWMALSAGLVAVEGGAQLFLGRTSVAGSGFVVNRTAQKLSPGLDAAIRLVGTAAIQPFFEAAVRIWFAPQDVALVDAGPADSSGALPRVEARLSVGMRFQLGR